MPTKGRRNPIAPVSDLPQLVGAVERRQLFGRVDDVKARVPHCLNLGGAVIALVILGMSALFRRTARNSEEMKQITSLRCLAAVPHVRSKARKTHKNRILSVMEKRVPYGYRESIRALQVRLERAMKKLIQVML